MFSETFLRVQVVILGFWSLASPAAPEVPYRRFLPLECARLDGSLFKFLAAENAIEGAFGNTKLLEGTKARLSVPLERELPPRDYLVFLSIPYVDKTVVRDGVPETPLGTERGKPSEITEEETAELEGREATPGEYKKEPGGLSVELRIGLGPTEKTFCFPRLQGGYTGGTVVRATKPFQALSLQLQSIEPRIRLNQIYLSSRPGDMRWNRQIAEKELICGISVPLIRSEMSGEPEVRDRPEPDNWIQNGSFEVGAGTYEWCTPYQSSQTIHPALLDSTAAAHGQWSLAMPLEPHRFAASVGPRTQILHKVIKLRPNSTYYFRGLFRADAPARVSVTAVTAYGGEVQVGGGTANVGSEWEPLTAKLTTTAEDRGYYVTLSASTATKPESWPPSFAEKPLRVWMDSLVLSARKPEQFIPSAPVEVGIRWTVPGKVFYAEEPVAFTLLARNEQAADLAEIRLRCRVVDYYDLTVLDEPVAGWQVPALRTAERPLDLRLTRTGAFRLLLDGEAATRQGAIRLPLQEYAFCVLRRPPDQMRNTFGAYINVTPEPLAIMSRAGIRRTVTLSSSNELLSCWERMEPEPGRFVWRDHLVEVAKRNRVEIIANLEAEDAPAWAMNPADEGDAIHFDGQRLKKGSFSRKAWGEFVEKVVEHYRDGIHSWLIVDEPYHYFSMKSYFDVVKTASLAARRADPRCKVLSHCGYYDQNLPALESMGIADLIDGVSGYSRGLGQGEKLRRFTEKHGKSLVTVEYSWQLSLYQTLETPQGSFDPFWRLPWYRRVGASLAAIPITSMAWSRSSGFNRYDARYPGGDFTQLDNYKCMFEYDGALKPSAVAYAVAAGLLDGFHGAGELKLHDGLDSFLLEETSTPGAERFALAFWAKGGQLGHTRIRLPESVRGMDVMGNPIRQAPKSMLLCGDVTYLIGPKSQLPATQDLVAKLEIKPVIRSEGKVELDDASGQYLCRVTVTNVLDDEAVKVKVGVNGQRNFWEYPKELPVLNPGQESSAVFGMNVYRWEKANPEVPPHFVFVEALGSSAY